MTEILRAIEILPEWATYGLLLISAIGLTWKQREAIRQRDEYKCQAQSGRIKCGGQLEVDHVLPKEFAEQALKMIPEEYNDPTNLLLKCLNHHRAHPESHHPDIHKAFWEETEGKQKGSIDLAVEIHREEAKRGHVYWNNKDDGKDRQRAKARTEMMDRKWGSRSAWWPWPFGDSQRRKPK